MLLLFFLFAAAIDCRQSGQRQFSLANWVFTHFRPRFFFFFFCAFDFGGNVLAVAPSFHFDSTGRKFCECRFRFTRHTAHIRPLTSKPIVNMNPTSISNAKQFHRKTHYCWQNQFNENVWGERGNASAAHWNWNQNQTLKQLNILFNDRNKCNDSIMSARPTKMRKWNVRRSNWKCAIAFVDKSVRIFGFSTIHGNSYMTTIATNWWSMQFLRCFHALPLHLILNLSRIETLVSGCAAISPIHSLTIRLTMPTIRALSVSQVFLHDGNNASHNGVWFRSLPLANDFFLSIKSFRDCDINNNRGD